MITNSLIGSANTTVFSASGKTAIVGMYFCNTSDTNNALFTVYAVKNGDSPSKINKIINNQELFLRETYVFNTERLIVAAGDTVVATATPSGDVSVTVTYLPLPE